MATQPDRLDRIEKILEDLAIEVARNKNESDHKSNQLLTDLIALTDNVGKVSAKVDRLADEAAVDRASFQAAIERNTEECRRIWRYLSDRHTDNGSAT